MSTVRLLVLGVVRLQGNTHGYAVHRQLSSWRVDTWTNVKPPSIYHTVKVLAREGKLHSEGPEDSPAGPNRVLYSITPAGESEFFAQLEAALIDPDPEIFGAGVAFMRSLTRQRVQALLEQRVATVDAIGVDLEALKPLWPDPSEPPHAQHLLDLWRGTFEASNKWTRIMLSHIKSGSFRFADDQL